MDEDESWNAMAVIYIYKGMVFRSINVLLLDPAKI